MKILCLCCLLLLVISVCAQSSDTSSVKKDGVIFLPAVFFSPETSLGFGGASLIYFRPEKNKEFRPSNIQTLFIYTLENQILFINPYNIFLSEEKYWFKGELGFYVYPYEFYGFGSDISLDDYEAYMANYLRTEINGLRRINEGFYLGPTLFMDNYFNIDTEENGRLAREQIAGIEERSVFGMGLSFILDRRNNIFSPSSGYYLEGRILQYEDRLIGAYPFTDMFIDARKYFYPGDKWEAGLQLYHQSVLGEPPFYNYALLGGSKLMRGYYKGAYRDHHQSVFQGELRRYVAKRFVVSAFGGFGSVASTLGDYDKLLGSYGVGLRYELNTKEHIRIRLDYARGHETSGFYININEAF